MKKCNDCQGNLFHIKIKTDCEDCEYNGVYIEHSGYTLDEYEFPRDYVRSQSFEEGECKLGDSFDDGCYQFVCATCGAISHLPLVVQ